MKKAVQIRLDADVLAWFKSYVNGCQSRTNMELRDAINEINEKNIHKEIQTGGPVGKEVW